MSVAHTKALTTRIILSLLIVGTVACNAAQAKDGQTIWIDLMAPHGGGAIGGLEFTAGVDADARQLDNSLDIKLSAITTPETENKALSMHMMDGSGRARMSDGAAEIELSPSFCDCDGPGMLGRNHGGSEYSGPLMIAGEVVFSVFVNVTLKTQAPDDWAGDPDALDVYVDASAMSPE
ncbi:MAG: hypothetical protein ACI9MC_000630 [Kiritimatiellia bacterium]|jgi:hypothetical protein